MATGWLNFDIPKPGWLNFGRTAEAGNELTIDATMPPPTPNWTFWIGLRLRHDVSIAAHVALPQRKAISVRWASGVPLPVIDACPWTYGQPFPIRDAIRWTYGVPFPQAAMMPWTYGVPNPQAALIRWTYGVPNPQSATLPWQSGLPERREAWAAWQSGQPERQEATAPWQSGLPQRREISLLWNSGQPIHQDWRIVWDNGRPAPHGWRTPIRPHLPGKQWGRLNFVCPWPGLLNFGNACFGGSLMYPAVKRSYRVMNSAALIRVSDGADIPVSNLTVKLDRDSWCWTLSAHLIGRTAYETVPASPGLVQATVNGFVWQFVVDDVDYSRAFGTFGGSLTGRSPVALLAEPYALPRSYRETALRTAQQLTLQELPFGFALDTTLPDWTVPANTFQYENLTPVEVIIRVTKACGGRVYSDPVEKIVYCAPRWPRKPWAWSGAADRTLPSSYTLTEKLQTQPGVEYEAVIVSGGANGGVVALCKRAGTGGLTHAPSVVDALITHLDAADPRGVQELADRWPMKAYTLELPLQAIPTGAGLITPGMVLDFADGGEDGFRGLVTGCTITATWNSVKQTLELISP